MGKGIAALVILVIIAVVSIALLAASFYSVGVSQVAILVNQQNGEFSGPVVGPTFGWKSPFFVNVVTMSTSTQTVTFVGNATGVFVLSQDNLEIEFDVNFRYHIDGNHAIDLYKHYPAQNWETNAIEPHIRAAFRDQVSQYPAGQIVVNRDRIQTGVEHELQFNIANDTSLANAVTIVSTQIVDITLPISFSQAIQAKLNAQQALAQALFEAQKTIALAQGQANATIAQARGIALSQIIQANAIKNATIIEANGTATALHNIAVTLHLNSTQEAQLTNTYVFMQQLQVLCAETNNPCQNMILFVGGSGGQIFELPVGTKP